MSEIFEKYDNPIKIQSFQNSKYELKYKNLKL